MNPDTVPVPVPVPVPAPQSQHFFDLFLKNLVTIASIITTIGGGGFWLGGVVAESKSNELKRDLTLALAKLEVRDSKIEQLSTALPQWQLAYQKLQTDFAEQQKLITALTTQLGRENNCTFIRQQIVATQKLIEIPEAIGFSGRRREDADGMEKERVVALQNRLAGYTAQLGSCR